MQLNVKECFEDLGVFTKEINAEVERRMKEFKAEEEAAKGNYEDLRTLRKRDWLTKEPPARKYIFNYREAFGQESGFMPEGKACMIASPGGCGKTFLLAHCALAAATGTNWLNSKASRPIQVLFVAAEEDEDELWHRFYNMANGLGLDKQPKLMNQALDNIIALPQRGRNQRLIDEKGKPTTAYNDLKKTIEGNPNIKLVILDPATRFMGNRNGNQQCSSYRLGKPDRCSNLTWRPSNHFSGPPYQ